jgi:hypothetical protein
VFSNFSTNNQQSKNNNNNNNNNNFTYILQTIMEALMQCMFQFLAALGGENQINNKLQHPYTMLPKIKLGLQMTYGCPHETPAVSSYLAYTFCWSKKCTVQCFYMDFRIFLRFTYMKAQHSIVFTTKSSSGASGSLPYVLQRWVRPWYKSPSNHKPNLPLQNRHICLTRGNKQRSK